MTRAIFKSDFAILDVKQGRTRLARRLALDGCVRVCVEMSIDYPHGRDDGTSVEFSCTVLSVKEFAR